MKKDLGYRKVQSVGRGSHIISLPKEWVTQIGVKRGSEIAFKVQDDSSLLLVPRKIMEGTRESEKPKLRGYWIQAGPEDDPQSLCRKITSLYVVSADLIRIRFKDGESIPRFKTAINSLAKNLLLGSEIIDETDSEITLQILIKHPDFPVERAIRRMAILALSANKDAISALKSTNVSLVRDVAETCNDVNRLDLYVVRQLKFGLEQNLHRELGFKTPKEFLGYRIVANDIKGIADNARNIMSNIMTFKKMVEDQILFLKEPIDDEVYSQILDFNSSAHQLFEESLKALFKRDYKDADRIVSRLDAFTGLENDLIVVMTSKKMDPNVSSIFRLILDNSRRIIENSRDIVEVTLNRTIEEMSAPNH